MERPIKRTRLDLEDESAITNDAKSGLYIIMIEVSNSGLTGVEYMDDIYWNPIVSESHES